MRIGGLFPAFNAQTAAELEPLCEKLDQHGLSAIAAPGRLAQMPDEATYGENFRRLREQAEAAGVRVKRRG